MCISRFFAEGARFAHEHAAVLAQGTIDGINDVRAAAAFNAAAVLPFLRTCSLPQRLHN